jgi:hypothetical protein
MKKGMEEVQPTGRRPDQIDCLPLWFVARGAQALLVVFYARVTYLAVGTPDFVLDLVSVVLMLVILGVFLRGIATGYADCSGIRYRLYFRLKTIAWAEIQEIQWMNFRLKVLIKRPGKRKRTVIFLLNPLKSSGAYWAHRLGAEVSPPEILQRIGALPLETPPAISSAPLYPKWILRAFAGLVILFVLVLLWKLLSASAIVPH